MISPTSRRSAIPVPASASARRLRSISRSRDTLLDGPLLSLAPAASTSTPPTTTNNHHDDHATDDADALHTFTLLEDNIALKERLEHQHSAHQLRSTDLQQQLLVASTQLAAQRAECERAQRAEAAVRVQLQHAQADAERRAVAERESAENARVEAVKRAEAAGRLAAGEQRAQHEAWAAQLRQQLASVELQLYEANERVAELTEEAGRQRAEAEAVTAIAATLCAAGVGGGSWSG